MTLLLFITFFLFRPIGFLDCFGHFNGLIIFLHKSLFIITITIVIIVFKCDSFVFIIISKNRLTTSHCQNDVEILCIDFIIIIVRVLLFILVFLLFITGRFNNYITLGSFFIFFIFFVVFDFLINIIRRKQCSQRFAQFFRIQIRIIFFFIFFFFILFFGFIFAIMFAIMF